MSIQESDIQCLAEWTVLTISRLLGPQKGRSSLPLENVSLGDVGKRIGSALIETAANVGTI